MTETGPLSAPDVAALPVANVVAPRVRASLDQSRNAYHAASQTARDVGLWRPPLKSADAEIILEAPKVRARARALVRNHPIARQAVRVSRQGVIGPRMRLALAPDYRFLGLTFEEAHDFATEVERLWESYAHGPDCLVDAGRRMNFTQMMSLIHDVDMIDGEALLAVEWAEARKWKTCFQVVDIDRLQNPMGSPETQTRRGGIELDDLGSAIGYWVRTRHPADWGINLTPWKWDFVPRETQWGRAVMCHTFDHLRPGQTRGMSEFASVVTALKMGQELDEVTLQTAILQTCLAIVLKSPASSADAIAMLAGGDPTAGETGDPILAAEMERMAGLASFYDAMDLRYNGQRIPHLAPGDELDMKTASHPSAQYEGFQKHQGKNISAGLGVDPVSTRQDYSDVNFSSARMAQANNQRGYITRRDRLVHQAGMQMLACWMEEAVFNGALELPKNITPADWFSAKDALIRGRFITAGMPMIDPNKERQAQQLGLMMGCETLDSICSENGDVWDEVLEQQAREKRKRDELGLLPMMPPAGGPVPLPDDPDKADTQQTDDANKTKDA